MIAGARALLLATLALLPAVLIGDLIALQLTVGEVGEIGGTGAVDVARGAVVVERVRLLDGTTIVSRWFNRVEVRLRVENYLDEGYYEVHVRVVIGAAVIHSSTHTVYLTTAATTLTINLGTRYLQGTVMEVHVHAKRVG